MADQSNNKIPDEWADVLESFERRVSEGRAMGGPEKLRKRASNGLLNARERIDLLIDSGSFEEIGSLVGMAEYDGLPAAPADALVGGLAAIDGRSVVLGSEDATVQGGSIGLGTHAKRLRLANIAQRERVPLIMILDGAGERMSNSLQKYPYAPNDMQEMAALSRQVPTIAIVLGASAGHGAITALLSDIVIMSQKGAIFAGGPPLVQRAIGEVITKEDLGGPTVHGDNGVVHNIAADEEQALAMAREYLSYLPSNAWEYAPVDDSSDTGGRRLDGILQDLPRDGRRPYDIRKIIGQLVDRHEFREFYTDFGKSIVTGFARLGGHSVGIVGNQPMVMGGAITHKSAEKAAYFISLADAYHLPVIFLTDNPGVMSGSAAEKAGTLRSAAAMYAAQCRLSSPKLHVTMRKAFGFGSSLMGMNPFDNQTISYAFPGIMLGGVPASSGGKAAKMSDAQRAVPEQIERDGWTKIADTLGYDEIIDPRDLRNRLLTGIKFSLNRRSEAPRPKI